MNPSPSESVRCRLVDEFVEDAGGAAYPNAKQGAAVRPKVVVEFIEGDDTSDRIHEFTVLLRDQRTVSVRGHGLKCVSSPSQPSDPGSYAIFTGFGESEVTVALFPVGEVAGIFDGNLLRKRESA